MRRTALVLLLAGTALLLTGCLPGTTPSGAATPDGTSSSEAGSPSTGPTSAPAAETAGDCTAGSGGDGREIPVVYTVYGPTSGGPVTVTFTSFNRDGSLPATTATFTGPVFTRIGYACSDAAQSAVWTLTATSTTTDAVACVLDFGGMLVKTDSAFLESATPVATTANCSGNPGQ